MYAGGYMRSDGMQVSEILFRKAREMMPGGVSSPVRAIKPYPFYVTRGKGSRIETVDGDEYIDCCCGYGPLILGHTHPAVMDALMAQIQDGWLYGTPTEKELSLASRIISDHPSVDMVRFVSSGSEATMAAIRLARGFTGRPDIIKIEGGFHGAHDGVLVQAGSGCTTLGQPDSAGINPDVVSHTRQVPFNDIEALTTMLAADSSRIAAIILEPVMGNIGSVLPLDTYLEEVRAVTREHDVLLIFDEVITGYRLGIGGAQVAYGISPDLSTFGKIIGGGLPIGAIGGSRDIMEMFAPAGPVYQAGTYSGNPLSLAAGEAALNYCIDNPDIYDRMEAYTQVIGEGITDRGGSFVQTGSMFSYFFTEQPPVDYASAKRADTKRFSIFWNNMRDCGIFLPPSQFETCFLSAAHSDADIREICSAFDTCL